MTEALIGGNYIKAARPVWVLFPESDGGPEVLLALAFILTIAFMLVFLPRSRWVVLILSVGVILYFTLLIRRPSAQRIMLTVPFNALRNSVSLEEGLRITDKLTFHAMVLNILFFVPYGTVLPLLGKWFRHWYIVLPIGFVTSLTVELTQYLTGMGVFDVDDLILNTLGSGIGFLVWLLVIRRWDAGKKEPDRDA